MKAYFIAANFWAAVALVIHMGRHFERSGPTMYSFLGVGRWFEPTEYNCLVAVPVVFACACFMLWAMSSRSRKAKPPSDMPA